MVPMDTRSPARTVQVVRGISTAEWHGPQISSISWCFTLLRGVVPNKILLLAESQNTWPQKKFQAGYTTARGLALNNITHNQCLHIAGYLNTLRAGLIQAVRKKQLIRTWLCG